MDKATLNELMTCAAGAGERDAKLKRFCEILSRRPGYDWVGFYFAENESRSLRLGPFVGEPTDHVLIPYGRGICGQAAERLETFVVADVTAELNYLSCSPKVRSEIVIPVFKEGRLVAELDLDSHRSSAFGDEDRVLLEEAARLAGELF